MVQDEVIQAEKKNSFLKYISIPIKINHYPFQVGGV